MVHHHLSCNKLEVVLEKPLHIPVAIGEGQHQPVTVSQVFHREWPLSIANNFTVTCLPVVTARKLLALDLHNRTVHPVKDHGNLLLAFYADGTDGPSLMDEGLKYIHWSLSC